VDSRIVIPPGSYVLGTITEIRRPGKIKGRGEFHLRFDSLTLPNGTNRDFRAHLTNLDSESKEELDEKEGTVRSPGSKADDVRKIGEATAAGAAVGGLAGIANGSPGMGSAIGAGAAAAVAVVGVMFSRGPEAVLAKGTIIEMVLDRQLQFTDDELDFSKSFIRRSKGDGLAPGRLRENPSH
jgi:type IV secretion system protein VirB10